jgi:anti-anti-sigma factor
MPQLNVALVPAPDQVVVRLTGDADLSTVPLVSDALQQATGLGTRQLVVDVAAARFWDVAVLHVLADVTRQLVADGRGCRIVGAPAATRRLIRLADMGEELDLDGPVSAVAETRPEQEVVPARRRGARRAPAFFRTLPHLTTAGTRPD